MDQHEFDDMLAIVLQDVGLAIGMALPIISRPLESVEAASAACDTLDDMALTNAERGGPNVANVLSGISGAIAARFDLPD